MKLALGKTGGRPLGMARGKAGFAFGRKANNKANSKGKPAVSKKPAVGDGIRRNFTLHSYPFGGLSMV